MKSFSIFAVAVVTLLVQSGVVSSSAEVKKDDPAKPIAALSWLVGGVWTADASKLGPGMQRIETRYSWSDNQAYVRFNTHFVFDKGAANTYDGNLYWNPDEKTLAIWYMDRENSIIQGPMQINGDLWQTTFRATDFDGKMADMRVEVTRKTIDHYLWALEEKNGEAWKEIAALEYLRKPSM